MCIVSPDFSWTSHFFDLQNEKCQEENMCPYSKTHIYMKKHGPLQTVLSEAAEHIQFLIGQPQKNVFIDSKLFSSV